jgi:hypothetical protein
MHAEVARLSSNGVHIVVDESGHDMPTEAPQYVVAAVAEVLASVRTQRPIVAAKVVAAARGKAP